MMIYDPLEMGKNQLRTNIYYRLNKLNEFSVFYNYEEGKGYAMGSLGPIYNRGLKDINMDLGLIIITTSSGSSEKSNC